jgi:phosphoribosyl 1,2-cyclic phosphodiesterase
LTDTLTTDGNGFKYSILASGSTGNSFYLETPKKKILVDAGLTGKKITELMGEIGRDPSELDALLVTHEHVDHIKGIGVLARKYGLDVYANELTWQIMDDKNMIGKLDNSQKHVFPMGKVLTFDDIDIESFGVSHDAIAPQFYRFMKDGKSFSILTDTGYVNDHIRGIIENSDAMIMETNHEVDVLRSGEYPWSTKQRILGDKGHLSNQDGAIAATEVIGDKTKRVFLGHISLNNNTLELAHQAMVQTLNQHDIDTTRDVHVQLTSHDTASPLYDI